MKKTKHVIAILCIGVAFLTIGAVWSVTIYKRCVYKEPQPKQAFSQVKHEPRNIVQRVQRTVRRARRSAHAEVYQVITFWAVAILEVVCAGCFVLSGLFLLMRSAWALRMVVFTIAADVVFKNSAIAYMHFCAIPLARLIGRRNILVAYYSTKDATWYTFSSYFSALKALDPGGWIFLASYFILLFLVLFYLFRPSVRVLFQSR